MTLTACTAAAPQLAFLQDTLGRLWWTEAGASCAYKDSDGKPLYYTGYIQVKWETAPHCSFAATKDNSMADAQGRLWSWIEESLTNCVFVTTDGSSPLKLIEPVSSSSSQ